MIRWGVVVILCTMWSTAGWADEPSPEWVRYGSGLLLLGGIGGGLRESCVFKQPHPFVSDHYHAWRLLENGGYAGGFGMLVYGRTAKITGWKRALRWGLGWLLLNKVGFEISFRGQLCPVDDPAYWNMAGLDGTRTERYLSRSRWSKKGWIAGCEIVMAVVGGWLVWGD